MQNRFKHDNLVKNLSDIAARLIQFRYRLHLFRTGKTKKIDIISKMRLISEFTRLSIIFHNKRKMYYWDLTSATTVDRIQSFNTTFIEKSQDLSIKFTSVTFSHAAMEKLSLSSEINELKAFKIADNSASLIELLKTS